MRHLKSYQRPRKRLWTKLHRALYTYSSLPTWVTLLSSVPKITFKQLSKLYLVGTSRVDALKCPWKTASEHNTAMIRYWMPFDGTGHRYCEGLPFSTSLHNWYITHCIPRHIPARRMFLPISLLSSANSTVVWYKCWILYWRESKLSYNRVGMTV